MRRSSLSSILGLGIVAAVFLAVVSVFYLQQLPNREDLDRLRDDIRRQHGLYLSALDPVEVELVAPREPKTRLGLRIECTLRPDILRRPATIRTYLERIGDSVLENPDWRGRIAFVTVHHPAPQERTVTRHPARPAPSDPPKVAGKAPSR